jgi:hypothetical protein
VRESAAACISIHAENQGVNVNCIIIFGYSILPISLISDFQSFQTTAHLQTQNPLKKTKNKKNCLTKI